MSRVKGHPKSMMVDHELAERFVRENWSALAASAWRFNIHYGPGALIVEWSVVERWSHDRGFPFQPGYATRTDSRDFNSVIAGYDPRTAIVIAFSDREVEELRRRDAAARVLSEPIVLRPGTALAAMTITAEPSPPQAHRARGH